ncbi:MAG: hypothetical protein ACK442_09125 [Novosphingobium sp.]|jgi:hypothetical protein|nr:hypothetical protein [Brevundimonas sp.]MCZ8322046.1 hypothetical protein [Novosphingobium sp.]
MSDPNNNFASLSPTLLARKGGARPAMRPQLGALTPDALARQIDDLGWNDMGDDVDPAPVAEVVSITPDVPAPRMAPVPAVVNQQSEVARLVAAPRRSALADGRRAAFTLRVDSERHLKLRLACAIRNRSAQQLVTEALDRLLDELPDVADLAAQVARKRK